MRNRKELVMSSKQDMTVRPLNAQNESSEERKREKMVWVTLVTQNVLLGLSRILKI